MVNLRNMYFLEFSAEEYAAAERAATASSSMRKESTNGLVTAAHVITIDALNHRIVPIGAAVSGQLPDVKHTVVRFQQPAVLEQVE